MTGIGWEKRVSELRQELTLIRSRASIYSRNFEELRRGAECCKVQHLAFQIEVRRKFLAHSRGATGVIKNGKGLPVTLGIAAAASVFIGIITKNRSGAVSGGLSGLNEAFRGLGETEWAICLEEQIVVASWDNITPGQVWFTLNSVRATLGELKQRAQQGAHLGNIDTVFLEMRRSKRLVFIVGQATVQIKTAG